VSQHEEMLKSALTQKPFLRISFALKNRRRYLSCTDYARRGLAVLVAFIQFALMTG
jgi:hypothetical protein